MPDYGLTTLVKSAMDGQDWSRLTALFAQFPEAHQIYRDLVTRTGPAVPSEVAKREVGHGSAARELLERTQGQTSHEAVTKIFREDPALYKRYQREMVARRD
jgi:hypothetical protein